MGHHTSAIATTDKGEAQTDAASTVCVECTALFEQPMPWPCAWELTERIRDMGKTLVDYTNGLPEERREPWRSVVKKLRTVIEP